MGRFKSLIKIRTIAFGLLFTFIFTPIGYLLGASSVSQGTYQKIDGLIGDLSRYSQNITDIITQATLSEGVQEERVVVLRDIYGGLSVMICNLVGLRLALKIEKLHANYKQINYEALSEVKAYAAFIDMHHDIQLAHCYRVLSDARDRIAISQLNNYIKYIDKAKNTIEDVKRELPL